MPAFVTNGPDIPERLLQAHEEGRVIFFCGAGVSLPAGLPLFKGLVDSIYDELGIQKNALEKKAYDKEQYDATLDQLERRYPGNRFAVRKTLLKLLKPRVRRKNATETHRALLQLASDRNGAVKLVTTNFDRLFEYVGKKEKLKIQQFAAPLLPISKPSRWDGIVYLHGLLPNHAEEAALNRLVLSSGDFGLAYLTERWAARFVSDLFRYYIVCFVGYGINDPVLRYMMDALAADELLGESKTEAYAFASYSGDQRDEKFEDWQSKGVIPLLYEVPNNTNDHAGLRQTLSQWAETYRDGVRGKEMIVAQHATVPPLSPSRTEFTVGRVLWALTDSIAAKHFAELDPTPPLEWLKPLSEPQFNSVDLVRFGVTQNKGEDKDIPFSFVNRPSPYTKAPWMRIVNWASHESNWDDVMHHLARWLVKHLNDPKLLIWVADQGGRIHDRFAWLVSDRLEELKKLEQKDDPAELDRIQKTSPNAVPDDFMTTLWSLVLSGRLKAKRINTDLYDWLRRYKQYGLSVAMRIELRELLTPCVAIREPFSFSDEAVSNGPRDRLRVLINWDLELSCNHAHSVLDNIRKNEEWQAILRELLPDFVVLLRDALDLKTLLNDANDKSDLSYLEQPSIKEHAQNRDFRDWTCLIDLTRDAWLATSTTDTIQAKHFADGWLRFPFPLFKRLTFFAATYKNVIKPSDALNYLLIEKCWWLWSQETSREAFRLLVYLASNLKRNELLRLERQVMKGPPRKMFKKDLGREDWRQLKERQIWLRLAKLKDAGAKLSKIGTSELVKLTLKYPQWVLAEDESDEFPYWLSDGSKWRKFDQAPGRRRELMEWLMTQVTDHWQEDDWGSRCRENFPVAACALCGLAGNDNWPIHRWREALQVWAEDELLTKAWRYMAPTLSKAPKNVISELSQTLGWWLKAEAKVFRGQDEVFFLLVNRILELEFQDEDKAKDDPVGRAINHPVGHVTDALLVWWYRQGPKDRDGLPDEIKRVFTHLCDVEVSKYRHGRVLMAHHVISLFRVDEEWAKLRLLPLFDWQQSCVDARGVWEGFLWAPQIHYPFLSAIKQFFLDTVDHIDMLGGHSRQYADFLTFVALDPSDVFTVEEMSIATSKLTSEGLNSAAAALTRSMGGAGAQREEYWQNRVLPYLKSVWPQSLDIITPEISDQFARLCITTQECFPNAFEELKGWLQPVENSDYLIHLLNDSGLCDLFPGTALEYLSAIVDTEAMIIPRELSDCLDAIHQSEPTLSEDRKFLRLKDLIRRRGTH